MNVKKLVRTVIGLSISALLLWVVLRNVSLEDVQQAFNDASLFWVTAALSAFAVGYACRIERWRVMLKRDNAGLSWGQCATPLLLSFAANNVLPFRAGDVLRAFAFNQRLGTSSGVVVATLVVERLLDLLTLLIFLGSALAWFGLDSSRFAGVSGMLFMACAFVILLVLLFPRAFLPLGLAVGRLIKRLAPGPGQKLLIEIEKSFRTLQHLSQGQTMMKLISWSLMAWLAEGCLFWFTALSLPSVTAPIAAWLALPVGTLATLIPSTPGYVGTFDFFIVHAMTTLGNALSPATAYAFLVHVLLWLPLALFGGFYLLTQSIKQEEKLKVSG